MQGKDGRRIVISTTPQWFLIMSPCLRHTKLFEDVCHRTKFRKSELEKVDTDETGKNQPVLAMEKRARLHSECKAEENKKTCQSVNPVNYYHRGLPPSAV